MTYHRRKCSEQRFLCLLKVLLVLRTKVESSLTGLLIRRCLKLDLVLVHDALHDLAERRGLVILASSGEVADENREDVGELLLLRCGGLDTRSSIPGSSRALFTRRFGCQSWKSLEGVGAGFGVGRR
jgi:hypothetical protein